MACRPKILFGDMLFPGIEMALLPKMEKLFGVSKEERMASGKFAVDLNPASVVRAPRSDFFFNFLVGKLLQ